MVDSFAPVRHSLIERLLSGEWVAFGDVGADDNSSEMLTACQMLKLANITVETDCPKFDGRLYARVRYPSTARALWKAAQLEATPDVPSTEGAGDW